MDPMTIFWIIWMMVLPVIAITLILLVPIFWFFIVPKISRMLTWKRFQKCSFHIIADDTGYVTVLPTTEEIPEGIVRTKKGYRFLPRPKWKEHVDNPGNTANLILRKFIWKDMGKPLWLGYAGKVAAVNPATLAGLQQSKTKKPIGNSQKVLEPLLKYVKTLPKTLMIKGFTGQRTLKLRSDLTKLLEALKNEINIQEYTVIDPTKIKQLISQMYTPSQLDALATNRFQAGVKRAGKQYTGLILGGGLIIGLVIIAILLVATLK